MMKLNEIYEDKFGNMATREIYINDRFIMKLSPVSNLLESLKAASISATGITSILLEGGREVHVLHSVSEINERIKKGKTILYG